MKSILFTPGNVKAILDGLKWQTRREIKPQPIAHDHKDFVEAEWKDEPPRYVNSPNTPLEFWCALCGHGVGPTGKSMFKSKYQVGETIYVKEAYYAYGKWVKNGLTKKGKQKWIFYNTSVIGYKYRHIDNKPDNVLPNTVRETYGWFKRSALFMPQKAARLFLEITNVRVEKLQDISEQDAISEGCENAKLELEFFDKMQPAETYTEIYKALWESIHGPGSWSLNPWVFAYDFKRVETPKLLN